MKLELKHLAPYLPYGLKVIISYHQEKGVMNLSKLSKYKCWLDNGGSIHLWQEQYIDKIKPILRPLSDLTKEIEHNREKFVPSKKYDLIQDEDGDWCEVLHAYYGESPIAHVMITSFNWWLFEYHFDVFGLIEKNLAIDINTL